MQVSSPIHPVRLKKLSQYIKKLDGLVAYYPLWEQSGAVAKNYAPDNLNSINGTTTAATIAQTGLVGNSYSFNGTSSRIILANADLSGKWSGEFSLVGLINTSIFYF